LGDGTSRDTRGSTVCACIYIYTFFFVSPRVHLARHPFCAPIVRRGKKRAFFKMYIHIILHTRYCTYNNNIIYNNKYTYARSARHSHNVICITAGVTKIGPEVCLFRYARGGRWGGGGVWSTCACHCTLFTAYTQRVTHICNICTRLYKYTLYVCVCIIILCWT